MKDSAKELFDNLLELVKFHADNNNVTYAEALGVISIVKSQTLQGKVFYKEKDLKEHFSIECKDLYFVLMSSLENDNIPETIGTLDLLHDFLIQEYHSELDLSFPYDDENDQDEFDEFDEDEFDDDDFDEDDF
jgi:hypothetical protein